MSATEQAGRAAADAIEALKGNPLCLAVVLLALVLSMIAYWREASQNEKTSAVVTTLIERCMEPGKR